MAFNEGSTAYLQCTNCKGLKVVFGDNGSKIRFDVSMPEIEWQRRASKICNCGIGTLFLVGVDY